MPYFADIILSVPIAHTFTYEIPEVLWPDCVPGKRVLVQFSGRRICTGLVLNVHEKKPEFKTKEILEVVDSWPLVSQNQLRFWLWLASYYLCYLGEVFKAALPASLKLESETFVSVADEWDDEPGTDNEKAVVAMLNQGRLTVGDIEKRLNMANALPLVKRMIDKGFVSIYEGVKRPTKGLVDKYVRFTDTYRTQEAILRMMDSLGRAPAQLKLIHTILEMAAEGKDLADTEPLYWHKIELRKKAVLDLCGVSASVLKQLVKKEVLEELSDNAATEFRDLNDFTIPSLAEFQQKAFHDICEFHKTKSVVLLQGITGSGKTEIYINLIANCLKNGQSALYLLPEIALTGQIIDRLSAVFGNWVGVYHSKFNDTERAGLWTNLSAHAHNNSVKAPKLILGVRSAIFLPFSNLGLIIVDEEHENTYKQFEPAPRYHARDAAIMLAHIYGAKVVLGSATPSVESYHNASSGKYGHVKLTQRFHAVEMPMIELINLRKEKRSRNMEGIFCRKLLRHLETAVAQQEQVILFQNRRGYAPYMSCNECGTARKCKYCDVSLTYHKFTNSLSCHYCGYSTAANSPCSKCKSTDLGMEGFGTEKIEDELQLMYPDLRIARLDQDTTRTKTAHSDTIKALETGKIDVLVGTQMVSKGLDFEHVNTVGIMDADAMLNYPDFRANERAFQLLTQVSGRAGRKHKRGLVLIQTRQPEHQVLQWVINNETEQLFLAELTERKLFNYPPFARLVRIHIKHKADITAAKAAAVLANGLRLIQGLEVLGPQQPPIGKVRDLFLQLILLKIIDTKELDRIKRQILQQVRAMAKDSVLKTAMYVIDVDPM